MTTGGVAGWCIVLNRGGSHSGCLRGFSIVRSVTLSCLVSDLFLCSMMCQQIIGSLSFSRSKRRFISCNVVFVIPYPQGWITCLCGDFCLLLRLGTS